MKKNFLFGVMAIALATFSFGGVSLADECTPESVAQIGEQCYATLVAAVEAVPSNLVEATTITLTGTNEIIEGAGIGLWAANPKNIIIDFNGHTYKVIGPAVGSAGTQTQGLHLEKGSKVTVKNGTLNTIDTAGVKMLVQNYCDLIIDNMIIDGTNLPGTSAYIYTVSNNFGSLTVKGNTNIIAKNGRMAFDLWYGMNPDGLYDDGVAVTFADDFVGTVNGNIEYGPATRAKTFDNWEAKVPLRINGNGTFNGNILASNGNDLSKANIKIYGGIFSKDPANYINEGYAILEKEPNKFYVMSLAAAATDESNTGNVQLPEGVTINTGNGPVTIDLSDGITDYLSGDIDTNTGIIEQSVLTGEIKGASFQNITLEGTVLLDFGNTAKFSRPIAIRIPVGTNPVKVKVSHGGGAYGYTGLTLDPDATCNTTDGSVTSGAYAGEDITPVGGYAVIYTCSASTFVAYSESNPTSTPTYGGGGGGSSSTSYSCKNLPDNAVANNTSKPKKNTDYSYSTDTGAVCTFQCKTGYTRNEKTSACDKADTTVEDTGSVNTGDTDNTTTEDLQKVLDDGFTVEFHYAYDFAFANGITTMKTIQEAAMEDGLTRIAMAKMLSQYAINVLKKTPDTSKECKFGDVSAELDEQYNNGVTLACQLGIMGVGITDFRPNDPVIRAEFGTALSRLLFGLADGEDAYYTTHLAKLKEEGIISNTNPDLQELRGYVMLMLMRSAK